ncbi:hypothetical protein E1A91_D02G121100v1 [Gossypium mustelinum]|uniref:Uncharacterized protein n=1 Tax=Gossypium mustelinum TaxID=34275 RepID=A0A5D2VUJ1_GOSMU|nr:hypothetical protein E1A91_D02G121100v1 [Gossypium mustelinum]
MSDRPYCTSTPPMPSIVPTFLNHRLPYNKDISLGFKASVCPSVCGCFTIPCTMTLATYLLLKCFRSAKKYPYLVSQSTTTKIVSFPSDFGKPTMKSKEMSSNT